MVKIHWNDSPDGTNRKVVRQRAVRASTKRGAEGIARKARAHLAPHTANNAHQHLHDDTPPAKIVVTRGTVDAFVNLVDAKSAWAIEHGFDTVREDKHGRKYRVQSNGIRVLHRSIYG